jgi:hypothetical protein
MGRRSEADAATDRREVIELTNARIEGKLLDRLWEKHFGTPRGNDPAPIRAKPWAKIKERDNAR